MKFRIACITATFAFATMSVQSLIAQTKSSSQAPKTGSSASVETVLYQGHVSDTGETYVTAMAVLLGGKLQSPPSLGDDDGTNPNSDLARFRRKYLGVGHQLVVLGGGAKVGQGAVTKRDDQEQISLSAVAKLTPAQKVDSDVLVASTDTQLKLHEDRRLPVTDADRAVLRHTAVSAFAAKHLVVKESALEMNDIVATRTSVNGARTLIGSMSCMGRKKKGNILLVLSEKPGGYVTELSLLNVNDPEADENGGEIYSMVGQVDIDGDGVDELTILAGQAESWQYYIYKHVGAQWQEIYEGGGAVL